MNFFVLVIIIIFVYLLFKGSGTFLRIMSYPTVRIKEFLLKYFPVVTLIIWILFILVLSIGRSLVLMRVELFRADYLLPFIGISAAYSIALYFLYRIAPIITKQQSQHRPWILVSLKATISPGDLSVVKKKWKFYQKNLHWDKTHVENIKDCIEYIIFQEYTPTAWKSCMKKVIRIADLCNKEFSLQDHEPEWGTYFTPLGTDGYPRCMIEDRKGFLSIKYDLESRITLEKTNDLLYKEVFGMPVIAFLENSLQGCASSGQDISGLYRSLSAICKKYGYPELKKPEKPRDSMYT